MSRSFNALLYVVNSCSIYRILKSSGSFGTFYTIHNLILNSLLNIDSIMRKIQKSNLVDWIKYSKNIYSMLQMIHNIKSRIIMSTIQQQTMGTTLLKKKNFKVATFNVEKWILINTVEQCPFFCFSSFCSRFSWITIFYGW